MPTLNATPEPGHVPPRVVLTGSAFTGSEVQVLRRDADGRSRPVRTADPVTLSGGGFTVYDYEVPFGYPSQWTAVPGTLSAQVTLDVPDVWLRHPGIPDLSLKPRFARGTLDVRTRSTDRSVHYPTGRAAAVALTGGRRKGPESQLVIYVDTLAELDKILALVDENVPLLLSAPPAKKWGITYEWISLGDVAEARVAPTLVLQDRIVTVPFVVVDRPVGNLQAQWTWASLATTYASWSEVGNAYATWADVLADTPLVEAPAGLSPAGWPATWPAVW